MNDRDPALDGVRGLAILLVVVYHVGIFAELGGRTGLDGLVLQAVEPLWFGVDLFFVLSGFLITGILYDAKGSPLYFRSFYGRRLLRIFPLYYGFLAFALLVFPRWLPPDAARSMVESQAWYWLYVSNVQVALHGWQAPLHLGHFWSLAVEEQFYLIWPLAVWALDRRALLRLAVACFTVALLLRLTLPFGMTELAAKVLLPTRMDSLAAGAFLALIVRGERGLAVLGRWPAVLLAGCAAAFVVSIALSDSTESIRSLARAVRYTFIAGACAALLALILRTSESTRLRRIFSSGLMVFLGKYSYGLYVVHVPVILLLGEAGFRPEMLPEWRGSLLPGLAVFAGVCATISIACAVSVFHAWEQPFLRLKRRLPYRAAVKRAGMVGAQPALTAR